MKCLLLWMVVGLSLPLSGQEAVLEWSPDYQLKRTDFRANAPNTGEEQSVHAYTGIEYKALNVQLLFSNLNKIVSNNFDRNASWLDEGSQTDILLAYAQTSWDLQEVAARKFRKRLFDNRKTLNANTMNRYLQETLAEKSEMLSRYSQESKFGRDANGQKEWEAKVDSLLLQYAQYCKACKKPKRSKKAKK